jgi:hypothetical protein
MMRVLRSTSVLCSSTSERILSALYPCCLVGSDMFSTINTICGEAHSACVHVVLLTIEINNVGFRHRGRGSHTDHD